MKHHNVNLFLCLGTWVLVWVVLESHLTIGLLQLYISDISADPQ